MSPLQHSESQVVTLDSDTDSESSTHSTIRTTSPRKSSTVSFASVSVREYERVLGDHPDVKVGPPISLGWDYEEKESQPIDEYEAEHLPKQNVRLSSVTRRNLLVNVFGVPEDEVAAATSEVQKIRQERLASKKQSKTSQRTEAFVESAKRKIKRRFSKDKLLTNMLKTNSMMFPTMSNMMSVSTA